MPRSRGSELPQGQSLRGPLLVRSSSSAESDSLNRHQRRQRFTVDRSPKMGVADRRSPRSSQPDSLQDKKKLGTRIADLESQLGQALLELKKLKDHLSSAGSTKREVQAELEQKVQKPIVPETRKEEDHESSPSNEKNFSKPDESTDVFEVPVDLTDMATEEDENKTKKVEDCVEPPLTPPLQEPERPFPHDSALLKEEIDSLNEKLLEKEMELELSREENEKLKEQVKDVAEKAASALAKEEEEAALKLAKVGEELEESKTKMCMLNEKLQAVEAAKELLETETKKLSVQTEQWKKAADEAAAILSGGVEMNGRTSADRCGSMHKYLVSGFGAADGFGGFADSPILADDLDNGFGSGKRKGSSSGIRIFGDLWKRKGQK